jgi:hypothetical protein
MVADVISWLGPSASFITAVGALPLANLVQNRGEHRVRSSIASSLKTLKELDDLKLSNEIALTSIFHRGDGCGPGLQPFDFDHGLPVRG